MSQSLSSPFELCETFPPTPVWCIVSDVSKWVVWWLEWWYVKPPLPPHVADSLRQHILDSTMPHLAICLSCVVYSRIAAAFWYMRFPHPQKHQTLLSALPTSCSRLSWYIVLEAITSLGMWTCSVFISNSAFFYVVINCFIAEEWWLVLPTTRGIVYNHLHHYDEDFDAEPFGVKLRCTSLKSSGDDSFSSKKENLWLN